MRCDRVNREEAPPWVVALGGERVSSAFRRTERVLDLLTGVVMYIVTELVRSNPG